MNRGNSRLLGALAAGMMLGATINSAWAGGSIHIASPTTQAQLIELYTSEGCSSCPPADHWLSGLKDNTGLWKQIVPVAFHVDYWNYLGWPDRFSSSTYSDRQRDYARVGALRTVYTPGFVVNGEEWRGRFRSRMLKTEDRQAGKLSAEGDASALRIRFEPAQTSNTALQIHVARLGFNLHTDVGAGENSGRKLQHDFVVLGYKEAALKQDGAGYSASVRLPPARQSASKEGVALWVTRNGNLQPLQAAGGWITP